MIYKFFLNFYTYLGISDRFQHEPFLLIFDPTQRLLSHEKFTSCIQHSSQTLQTLKKFSKIMLIINFIQTSVSRFQTDSFIHLKTFTSTSKSINTRHRKKSKISTG